MALKRSIHEDVLEKLNLSEDALKDTLNLVADVMNLVEHALLSTSGHIPGAVALKLTYLCLFLRRVVKLMLADLLANLHKLLGSIFPILGVIVSAIVAKLY